MSPFTLRSLRSVVLDSHVKLGFPAHRTDSEWDRLYRSGVEKRVRERKETLPMFVRYQAE